MGFNGATAMKPWKSYKLPDMAFKHLQLQWGHGDEAVEEPRGSAPTTTSIQLQWGHGDEAVEEAASATVPVAVAVLQWGHGDEAVEEQESLDHYEHVVKASMGPRR